MDKSEVNKAIEQLLEVLKNEEDKISNELKDASEKRDFKKSEMLSKNGERIKKFYNKVKELKNDWEIIYNENLNLSFVEKRERLKKGLKTKEEEYFIPILETLTELGGRGTVSEVLDRVYEKMKDKLNKYDLENMLSNPRILRWENTAQWARAKMVSKGLISSSSEKGVWEITQKGRNFLEQKKSSKEEAKL